MLSRPLIIILSNKHLENIEKKKKVVWSNLYWCNNPKTFPLACSASVVGKHTYRALRSSLAGKEAATDFCFSLSRPLPTGRQASIGTGTPLFAPISQIDIHRAGGKHSRPATFRRRPYLLDSLLDFKSLIASYTSHTHAHKQTQRDTK